MIIRAASLITAVLLLEIGLNSAWAQREVSRAPIAPPVLGSVYDHSHHFCRYGPRYGWPGQVWQFRDARSGILIKVDHDGRHLLAINPNGELLWHRDPHAGVEQYRFQRTCILTIGPALKPEKSSWSGWSVRRHAMVTIRPADIRYMVELTFDNSQFGFFDLRTGEFFGEGQN